MTYRLPIEKILLEAVRLPWRERRAYLRGLAVPGVALIAFEAAWWTTGVEKIEPWMGWTLALFYWLLMVAFLIACHRLALLETVRESPTLWPSFSRREALFAARLVGAAIIYVFVQWCVMMMLMNPFTRVPGLTEWDGGFLVMRWIGALAGMYVFSRLALVLPATAIDEKTGFIDAWSRTRGNGWRMLIIVGAVPKVITYALDWLFDDVLGVPAAIAASAVIAAFLAVEVTALSLSYRALTPPPLPEPSG